MDNPNVPLDFCVEVSSEKVSGDGEDAYLYSVTDSACVAAVFDGCGGSGAKHYMRAHDKTGAYLASRIVAGATRDWFVCGDALLEDAEAATSLGRRARRYLRMCEKALGQPSRIRGSITKELPTTCAVTVLRTSEDGPEGLCLWAGDSRCYLLDTFGLCQISTDDVGELDAMDNLSADGVLTNVVSASAPFSMHAARVMLTNPAVLFAATDGCFGYLSTPMEFEHLLLSTLLASRSPMEWEQALHVAFDSGAGDDATLCGLSVGFGSFDALKDTFAPRLSLLEDRYICRLEGASSEEQRELWQDYQTSYYR